MILTHALNVPRWNKKSKTLAVIATGILIGLIALKSWVLASGLFVAAIVSLLALRSTHLLWVFFLVEIFFMEHYVYPPASTVIFWGMAVIFIFLVFFRRFIQGKAVVWSDPIFWIALITWYIWGVVCMFMSPDLSVSSKELFRYGVFISFLLAYIQWFSQEANLRFVIRGLWIGLCFYAVILLFKTFLKGDWPDLILGVYWHSNAESAVFFAAFIPIFLSLMRHMRGRIIIKVFWLLAFFGLIVVLGSSAAMIATIIGSMVLFALVKPQSGWRLIIFGTTAVIGLVVIGLIFVQGFDDILIHQLSGRERIWPAALEAITSNPIFGVGPGLWTNWFGSHYLMADFIFNDLKGNTFLLDPATLGGKAHSLFLTKAVEMGIPSVIFLIMIFGLWFRKAISVYCAIPDGFPRDMIRGCLVSFIGLTFYCFFESGPILGTAREGEILYITMIMAVPFAIEGWYRQNEESI